MKEIRKELVLPVSQEIAFKGFSAEIGAWWPLKQLSVFEEESSGVQMDSHIEGEIVETGPEGKTAIWGIITAWNPFEEIAFTWYPGREAESAQHIRVFFEMFGAQTKVTLLHDQWETLGERAEENYRRYDTGWDFVFGECYGGFVEKAASRK